MVTDAIADNPKKILLPTVDTGRKNINPRIILGTTKENFIVDFQKNALSRLELVAIFSKNQGSSHPTQQMLPEN
jgi:hypothetical protein